MREYDRDKAMMERGPADPYKDSTIQRFTGERVDLVKEFAVSVAEMARMEMLPSKEFERYHRVRFESEIAVMAVRKISIHEKWPADWWQAFKERWFPAWLLRKYPVEYRKVDVEEKIFNGICPHIRVPDSQFHFDFLAQNSGKWKEV